MPAPDRAPCVLVTRPAAQADEWVAALQARGIAAAALPLIEIRPPADPGAVRAAWEGLAARHLVMFVSPNAVEGFFARRPAGAAWPPELHAASPGPGTSHALLQAGVPPSCIVQPAGDATQFDSEALWQRLSPLDWQGAEALVVRGDTGREWLTQRLRERGARVQQLPVYRRALPVPGPAQRELLERAQARPPQHLWLFSSAEAIGNLMAMQPQGRWDDARALATHPRIAERARAAGFGTVLQCAPTLDAVSGCIQSIAP